MNTLRTIAPRLLITAGVIGAWVLVIGTTTGLLPWL